MKKFIKIIKFPLIAGVILLMVPAIAQALPWNPNENLEIRKPLDDYKVYSYITGSGGLFEIKNISRDETVYGFCVELDEWWLSPSYVYDADDDVVWRGGRDTDKGDPLSGGTQWLYWKYLTDTSYQSPLSVKAIQLAIWYLEDEYFDILDTHPYPTPEEWADWYIKKSDDYPLTKLAYEYIYEALEHNSFQSDQILALDVYDGVNENNQKQSCIYHVPEPMTVAMLGVGILGFGIFARRFFRKKI